MTITTPNIKDNYLSEFDNLLSSVQDEPSFITDLRKAAREAFETIDFPTTRNEDWKYTNINPLLKHQFDDGKPPVSPISLSPYKIAGEDCFTLVFINGCFIESLSDKAMDDVVIRNIHQAKIEFPKLFEEHFSKYAAYNKDAFSAWNTAFHRDGAFIHIPAKVAVSKPIHLLFLNDNSEKKFVTHPRNLIIAETNSECKLVESHHSISANNPCFINGITEIVVKENAIVDYYKIQLEDTNAFQVDTTSVHQEASSNFSSHAITLGGALVRNNLNIRLNGEGCETAMMGLSALSGNQHADQHTFIDHAFPHCHSNELYKSVMDEKSHGVFCGKILVRKDAQKTNAFQSSKNVLLTEQAQVDAKPQLEIFANDVKCSHGATTGRLNDEALFYMQSRGIGKEQARALLIYAFAGEIFDTVKVNDLKENIRKFLSEKLDVFN